MEFLEAATSLLRLKTNKEKLVQRLEDYTVPRSINTHTHTEFKTVDSEEFRIFIVYLFARRRGPVLPK
jgi:adenine deaminase